MQHTQCTQWLISFLTLAVMLAAVLVYAADTPAEISLILDQHRFSPEEIQVKANTPFVLIITNKDNHAITNGGTARAIIQGQRVDTVQVRVRVENTTQEAAITVVDYDPD